MDNRSSDRKDIQVIAHFNFHGQEKVFQSVTRNISAAGIFVEADADILELMNTGESIILMLEYKRNFFMKVASYVVRLDFTSDSSGFAVKFLDIEEEQKKIISLLLD